MKNELYKENTDLQVTASDLQEPSLFRVLLLNDDFTPKEFVVAILEKFFFMDRKKAIEVMMEAQANGMAGCGTFAKDFAEAKISQVIDYARIHEHPLICSMEAAV